MSALSLDEIRALARVHERELAGEVLKPRAQWAFPRGAVLLYFLQNPDSRLVKIGISTNLLQRWAALNNACGSSLRLLAVGLGSAAEERRLHRLYAKHRRVGEWFDPAPAILTRARTVAAQNRSFTHE